MQCERCGEYDDLDECIRCDAALCTECRHEGCCDLEPAVTTGMIDHKETRDGR